MVAHGRQQICMNYSNGKHLYFHPNSIQLYSLQFKWWNSAFVQKMGWCRISNKLKPIIAWAADNNDYRDYAASQGVRCWYHQMETFSALLAICAGNSPVTGECPTQRPVMRSFDVFFDLSPEQTVEAGDLRCHHAHYDITVLRCW